MHSALLSVSKGPGRLPASGSAADILARKARGLGDRGSMLLAALDARPRLHSHYSISAQKSQYLTEVILRSNRSASAMPQCQLFFAPVGCHLLGFRRPAGFRLFRTRSSGSPSLSSRVQRLTANSRCRRIRSAFGRQADPDPSPVASSWPFNVRTAPATTEPTRTQPPPPSVGLTWPIG